VEDRSLGDLGRTPALVHVAQRLVVDVLVEVALSLEVIDDRLAAPSRPVMLAVSHDRVAAMYILMASTMYSPPRSLC